jgi:hypothetical protein
VLAIVEEEPAQMGSAAVLGDRGVTAGQEAGRLAALLDPRFLAEAGWDPVTWVLAPAAGYRLIRWDGGRLDAPGRKAPSGRDAPLPVLGDGKCAVVACLRARFRRQETHCAVHAGRWEAAHRADPQLDESWWNRRAEPVPVTGQVNLRGLAPLDR